MKRFWAVAARHWPLAMPSGELTGAIGADNVATLLRAGVLHEAAIGETVSCTTCRRAARIVWEEGTAVAVCTGDEECPWENLGERPARLVVNAADLARRIAVAFALDGSPGHGELVMPLGRRRFGEETVAVDLCPYPGRSGMLEALRGVARGGPPVRIALVPHARQVRADAPREMGGVELLWLGLDEVLVAVGGGLQVDLRPLMALRAFKGLEAPVTAPRARLQLEGGRVRWGGHLLAESPTPLAVRLLAVLAGRPGELVPRAELWSVLWPDDHTRTGKLARGVNPDSLDQRLRALVAELRAALRGDVGEDVLENQRGDERTGGYRLALPPEQVVVA